MINTTEPRGWDNQLHNEPGVVLFYERQWRRLREFETFGFGVDMTPHVGAALGNVYTYGATGVTFRVGRNLPADYGPPRIRPSLPGSGFFLGSDGFGWYLFAGVEGRAVGRDIFLDGNTFEDSQNVDKKNFVADGQAGIAVTIDDVRLASPTSTARPSSTDKRPPTPPGHSAFPSGSDRRHARLRHGSPRPDYSEYRLGDRVGSVGRRSLRSVHLGSGSPAGGHCLADPVADATAASVHDAGLRPDPVPRPRPDPRRDLYLRPDAARLWIQEWFDLERNPYDRLAHVVQGFVPTLIARELLIVPLGYKRGPMLNLIIVCICVAISAVYELIEWWGARVRSEKARTPFSAPREIRGTPKPTSLWP